MGWADYHLQLADYLHDIGHYAEADRLLWGVEGNSATEDEEGVLDIYEEHFRKVDPEEETELKLARAVLLTSKVKNSRGSHKIAKDLAGRARRIYEHYGSLALQSVAVSLVTEGRACELLGDLEESVVLGQAALDILEKHVSMNPGNLAFRRNLGVGLNSVGRVLEKQGELKAALSIFERSLEIAEDLVSKEPGNLAYLRDLGIGLVHNARVRLALGERDHAENLLNAAIECFRTILDSGAGYGDVANKLDMAKELLASGSVENWDWERFDCAN